MKATQKYIRTSPRKLRLVADAVRHLDPGAALQYLRFLSQRAAGPLHHALRSAIANAKSAQGLGPESLRIKSIDIAEGPTYKRWRAVSRGSAHSVMKRTSHINITLEEKKHGTKS